MAYNTPGYSSPLLPGFTSFYGPKLANSQNIDDELIKSKKGQKKIDKINQDP